MLLVVLLYSQSFSTRLAFPEYNVTFSRWVIIHCISENRAEGRC